MSNILFPIMIITKVTPKSAEIERICGREVGGFVF